MRAFIREVPLVSGARHVEGVDSATSDNVHGARLATSHLLELGHQRIVLLANPQTDGYTGRLEGYCAAMKDAGHPPWIVPSHYARDLAAADVGPVLDLPAGQRPTAVFAHNDQAAMGVLDAMATRGLQAPRDVSVVGYDNTRSSRAPGTALTTVDIHGEELGAMAAELAHRRLADPGLPAAVRTLAPTLVVRDTTAPPSH